MVIVARRGLARDGRWLDLLDEPDEGPDEDVFTYIVDRIPASLLAANPGDVMQPPGGRAALSAFSRCANPSVLSRHPVSHFLTRGRQLSPGGPAPTYKQHRQQVVYPRDDSPNCPVGIPDTTSGSAMMGPVLHRPDTKDELLSLLAEHGDEATLIAGGTALTIMWKHGLVEAEHLIDCTRVPDLDQVRPGDDDAIRIGCLVRLRDIELSETVIERVPLLSSTLNHVANLRVRNAATIGGNLAEADYSSDPPCVLTARGASVRLESIDGERWVPMTDFIEFYYETVMEPEEFLTEVSIPAQPPSLHGAYVKFVSRSSEDRTCLGIAALVDRDEDGRCTALELCVTGGTATPIRLPEVESSFLGQPMDDASIGDLAAEYAGSTDLISDVRASADYRRRVMHPLIVQAVQYAASGRDGAFLV